MSAILCLIMVMAGMGTENPMFCIAAGLFAIAAEIAAFRDRKEKEKKNEN